MLNAEYETSYISNFTKIFAVLKEDYEVMVDPGEYKNYEINIKKINDEEIKDYMSICFQKQNGSLTIIISNKVDEELANKLVNDVSLALNKNVFAKYNFTNLKDYTVYHFVYVKEETVINNRKLLEDLKDNGEIEKLSFNYLYNQQPDKKSLR